MMRAYFTWTNLRLGLMMGLVIFLFSFTSIRNNSRKLKGSAVFFVEENSFFIKQESVNKLLIENNSQVSAIEKVTLDLNKLEKSIAHNPMVEKSEVYVSIDGILKAEVAQKTPIARVFDASSSYYIDYHGRKMPLSEEFTARVPVVSGIPTPKSLQHIVPVLQYIFKDPFLKKNIIGIQLVPVTGLRLLSRNYTYDIEFGKPIRVEEKFTCYKAFYQKAVLDSSLTQYKRINLKFAQQVVCIKK
ncbi:MAG: cell division protein FtsQ/DivIB [Flavobacterium sp.]|jgi:cell division protein FtsQ